MAQSDNYVEIRGYIFPPNIGDGCLSTSRYTWHEELRTFEPEAPIFTLKRADKTESPTMMLQRNPSSAAFIHLALLLTLVSTVNTFTFCSRDTFGSPRYSDCSGALSALPTSKDTQIFVEQQLRTQLPALDWPSVTDRRPPGIQKKIVQVPKLWSNGESTLCAIIPVLSSCRDREC